MSTRDDIKSLIQQEANAILNLPESNDYLKAIEFLHHAVHIGGGKIVTSGMGKAGQSAHTLATNFSATGTPSVFLHPSEAQHGDLGILQPNDIFILVSNSGKTREIEELVHLGRGLKPDVKFVLITGNPDTWLGKEANVSLSTGNPKEICALGLAPTTSVTVMNVICDILVVLMMKKIGYTAEEYAKRHHGGYLGQASRSIANT
jgi:arabinose-5-phosphate isomerase